MLPLLTPSKIAFVGDWHMNGYWAVDVINRLGPMNVDIIVHLGDFGYIYKEKYLTYVSKALKSTGIPLIFVDGNHESHSWILNHPLDSTGLRPIHELIWHIPRGFRWEWDGVKFLGMGGAHSVDASWRKKNGHLWQPQEDITDAQVDAAISEGPADVLISHDCPDKVYIPGLDETGSFFPYWEIIRSGENRARLQKIVNATQPRMILHGHYHRRSSKEVDFGYGEVTVHSLDCDNTSFDSNVLIYDMADIVSIVRRD